MKLLVVLSAISQLKAYYGPRPSRELYVFEDSFLYFHPEEALFDEANAICQSDNMQLARLDGPQKAQFVAESMVNSWSSFGEMWIGAQKNKDVWFWTSTNEKIEKGTNTSSFPQWVGKDQNGDCLAVDRNSADNPLFVELLCSKLLPFICEQETATKREPKIGAAVTLSFADYYIYYGRLSWPEAVTFCQQQGYYLAAVENMVTATKLSKRTERIIVAEAACGRGKTISRTLKNFADEAMLQARPEFEDAWIGAHKAGNQWLWIHSGKVFDEVKRDKRAKLGDFPPWFGETRHHRHHDCAVLDRHLCEEPTFIQLKCDRKRNVICMKGRTRARFITTHEWQKKRYTFYLVAVTWAQGKELCQNNGATMLSLQSVEETEFVMQAMAESSPPLDHLWLAGRLVSDRWVWDGRNQDIPTEKDDTGFPPWCDSEARKELECLNLDRHSLRLPVMYGLECNATQAVVCVSNL